jgi:hypothetical protein
MVVVAHYGIRQQIDSEHLGQVDKTILYPLPAMIKVLATVVIIAAEKRASNAACCAMVIRCVVEADLLAAGNGHVESVIGSAVAITAQRDQDGSNTNYSVSPHCVDLMGVHVSFSSAADLMRVHISFGRK